MAKNSEGPTTPAHWVAWNKPSRVVGFLLRSLHLTLRQHLEETMRREGVEVSFADMAALFGLHFAPGATGGQLARRALVSAQTMNASLRRLEAEGLTERRPHPKSRRADSWYLTADGVSRLEHAKRVGDTVFEKMLSPLDASEVEQLEAALSRCIVALGSDDPILEGILDEHARRLGGGDRKRA